MSAVEAAHVRAKAYRWVSALWQGRPDQAQALISPNFDVHNGWSAHHYVHHELDQYQRHARFTGWEHGFDIEVQWLPTQQCWNILVLDAQGEPTTHFWWWWDEQGVMSNGWPFQMIPKLDLGPWGIRRKITHDATSRGWRLLPVGQCDEIRHDHHHEDDGFSAVSWSAPEAQDPSSVMVHAQGPARQRFKTVVTLPSALMVQGLSCWPQSTEDDRALVLPLSARHAFALDVDRINGHDHQSHPSCGVHRFASPWTRATLTDRWDNDWTVMAPAN